VSIYKKTIKITVVIVKDTVRATYKILSNSLLSSELTQTKVLDCILWILM
jgi:hypothetical protein